MTTDASRRRQLATDDGTPMATRSSPGETVRRRVRAGSTWRALSPRPAETKAASRCPPGAAVDVYYGRVSAREGQPETSAGARLGPAPAVDDEARRAQAKVASALFGEPDPRAVPYARVDRYELDSRLGAGSMGVVYQAWDPQLERPVAIKVLHSDVAADHKARRRLIREAKSLARLSHPNVIQVYDVGTDADRIFVAMELVDGVTLKQWLCDRVRTWTDVIEIMRDAGRGVAAAHRAGLVHRDLKPENILIGRDGRVRVLDFGLARASARPPETEEVANTSERSGPQRRSGPRLETTLTETGTVVGTPLYMAPEQLLDGRAASPASDQYSYCLTLYEALYGQRAFAGTSLPSIVANMSQGHLRVPGHSHPVPVPVFRALRRGLDSDPNQRWRDLDELLTAIDAAIRAGRAPRTVPQAAWWVIAVALAVALTTGFALLWV
ncbi:MAG: serine/threonine protein kinase [Myxococcales bacterium FL481]|nr:MAG: serine/threonine protein kinase [Myxococcales bacterium FL481]